MHCQSTPAVYLIGLNVKSPVIMIILLFSFLGLHGQLWAAGPLPDTGQIKFYNNQEEISEPLSGDAFFGQDAHYDRSQPSYTDNADGTVTDNITGLMWQKSPDTDGDGDIDADDKFSYDEALARTYSFTFADYNDWRLPSIKELYSLINFSGTDPSVLAGDDTSGLIPFIDNTVFDFAYGDTSAGERIIDAQYASSTLYVSNTANDGGRTLFGVNFADGRIKGYGLTLSGKEKTFFVIYVRDSIGYGQNNFTDNHDGSISDHYNALMWSQTDSGKGLNWQESLAWVAQKNAENYLGYNDWRLPDVKELQGLVDYSRSPDTTDSAAINALFEVSPITNEAGQTDYPFFWSSTTHLNSSSVRPGTYASYIAFGRALGYMNNSWVDVHGAGAQRSDPKTGNPADYPTGHGPQGDAIRIYNYVRLVRSLSSGVPLQGAYNYYLPYYSSSGNSWTGLGLANHNHENPVNLQATVFGQDGDLLATEPRTVSAYGQEAFPVAPELDNSGWILVNADQEISGLAFLGSGEEPSLMTDIPFADELSKCLVIPHVAQDDTWDTIIFICNPTSENISVAIKYVDKVGVEQGARNYTIPAYGSKEYLLSVVFGNEIPLSGRIEINSLSGVAAFALYKNQKSGGNYCAGINADSCE